MLLDENAVVVVGGGGVSAGDDNSCVDDGVTVENVDFWINPIVDVDDCVNVVAVVDDDDDVDDDEKYDDGCGGVVMCMGTGMDRDGDWDGDMDDDAREEDVAETRFMHRHATSQALSTIVPEYSLGRHM